MATFTGAHRATLPWSRSPADAVAAWADPARQVACRPEVVRSAQPGPGQLRLVLKEMKHGPTAFSGDYTLQFTASEGLVTWTTLPGGNPQVRGSARFVAAPGGCTVQVEESVSVEMPVSGIAATLLRPIVETMMARGMASFAERMTTTP